MKQFIDEKIKGRQPCHDLSTKGYKRHRWEFIEVRKTTAGNAFGSINIFRCRRGCGKHKFGGRLKPSHLRKVE